MIHLERTSLLSEGGDASQYSYQVHVIDNEDKLSQLIALEQQLELTEKRFRSLQNYVEYIRTLYHGSLQDPSTLQVCNLSSCFPLSVGKVLPGDQQRQLTYYDEERDAAGDGSHIRNKKKKDTGKKKKGTRKKSQAKKCKTPSKRSLNDEPSQKLIEKKVKVKPEKVEVKQQQQQQLQPHYQPKREIPQANYLNPTVSSQMKRIRPCHPSFNFRSIPFVAGMATTRSHNLGVKIQETLSIIKRNTPAEVGKCADQPSTEPRQRPTTSLSYNASNPINVEQDRLIMQSAQVTQ